MTIPVISNHIAGINLANEFCCALFTLVVIIALLVKKNHSREVRSFIHSCCFSTVALGTDIICYLCAGNSQYLTLMVVMTILSYTCTAFFVSSFLLYIMTFYEARNHMKYKPAAKLLTWVYAALDAALYGSSVWNGLFFFIDENVHYQAGPYSVITAGASIPPVLICIAIVLYNRKAASKRDNILHILFMLSEVALGFLDAAYVLSLHYIVSTIFVFLIFIFIGLERDKQLEVKQKELAISELNALRLQMNPHFVYNTLASIDGLVLVEPEEARELIAKFTKHLRGSYLNDSPTEVSFAKEMENIKCYLSVEEVRFPDLSVQFDLQTLDFGIPPLTIQPIVENAVKHGICKKDDAVGTITISSYADDKNYYIRIVDDGVGFDVNAPKKVDGRSHIGIENTKKRLELICGGSLDIISEIGVGTTATIRIPKEKK